MAKLINLKERKPSIKEGFAGLDLIERMFNNVNALNTNECWLWKDTISAEGYGIARRTVDKKVIALLIHRVSYYYNYGSIPEDVIVDHSCHNPKDCINGVQCQHRRCYNPHHLRLLTRAENTARGANPRINVGLCRNNLHAWTDENVYTYPSGKQMCMACQKEQIKRKYQRKKEVKING